MAYSAPVRQLPHPYLITTLGRYGCGLSLTNMTASAISSTWAIRRIIYMPFELPFAATILKLGWVNGATVSGNVECGIYSSAAGLPSARLLTTGSTAQGTVSTIQTVDTTDTTFAAGAYFAAISLDNATGTLFCAGGGNNNSPMMGPMEQTPGSFGLPATATPITHVSAFRLPLIGMATRVTW